MASSGSAQADVPPVPGGIRVDGMAAIVGGSAPGPGAEVILRSDVDLRARIGLSGQGTAAWGSAPVSTAALSAALEQLIGEVLISREADRVRVQSPTDDEVERELGRLEREAGGALRLAQVLRGLGAGREEIETMARRRATVSAFLRANLEGTTVITDSEVARAYETAEHPFPNRPIEEVREQLRGWLARRALDRAIRRWVGVLRARTTVTVLVTYPVAP